MVNRIESHRVIGVGLLALGAAPFAFSGASPDGSALASGAVQVGVTVPAASACLVAALVLFASGRRRALAEPALFGAALGVLSMLALLHGAASAMDDERLSWWSMAAAFPATALAGIPLVLSQRLGLRRVLARRWHQWSAGWLSIATFAVPLLVASSASLPPVPEGAAVGIAAAVAILSGAPLAGRFVRLYRIGRRPVTLITAASVVAIACAGAAGLASETGSDRWWVAHAVESTGVLVAAMTALLLVSRNRSLGRILAPLSTDDPVATLELGLIPEVQAFIAALDRKDRNTQEHVVRVSARALRAAARAGIPPARLRRIGLGALLHDIGKLVVPSDVLTKAGQLTDEEFAAMRTHAARGAAILERSPALREVAPLVRWHHERHDGTGYPDRLRGDEIPFDVAIISACDAWDAITHDRHYRAGRSAVQADAILRGGAGSQWHPAAVELVLLEAGATEDEATRPRSPTHLAAIVEPRDEPCHDQLTLPVPTFIVTTSGIVTFANAAAATMLGRPVEEIVGSLVLDLYADVPEGRARAAEIHDRFRVGEAIRDEQLAMRGGDGQVVWVRLSADPVRDEDGKVIESRSIAVDISAEVARTDSLRRMAMFDELTGLPNRRGFIERAEALISAAPRGSHVTVAFVDLDGLKAVNDEYGHTAGDQALLLVAEALQRTCRDRDVVGRLGGDEFAVVLVAQQPIDTEVLAARLSLGLSAVAHERGVGRAISATVGAASAGATSGVNLLATLLDEADRSMYRARSQQARAESTLTASSRTDAVALDERRMRVERR